jgi:UDPglucose--hexose-1-phosphate uridylyltransferase
MAELRYNPLLRDWTLVAANRQHRPDLPEGTCPFCPGSGKVPSNYTVLAYDNDFPVLLPNPPRPDEVGSELYRTHESYGKCELILYSSDHQARLPRLPIAQVRELVDLWAERTRALAEDPRHEYVLIFENRGPEVGATLSHPHGQLYALPYVPLKLRTEMDSFAQHRRERGDCLMCTINREEQRYQGRLLAETDRFVSYIPFFTDFPYGAFIVPKAHRPSLLELEDEERTDLARMLRWVIGGMDRLFDRDFPTMMVLHQRAVNGPLKDADFHFHIEFYPPLRGRESIKYLASAETGAWAPANPLRAEDTAPFLRSRIAQARDILEPHSEAHGQGQAHPGNAGARADLPLEEIRHDQRQAKEAAPDGEGPALGPDLSEASARSALSGVLAAFLALSPGPAEEVRAFFAPGRVNLLGEHTDYNGGFVLSAALETGTWALVRPRADGHFRFHSTLYPEKEVAVSTEDLVYRQEDGFANYPKGVLWALQNAITQGVSASQPRTTTDGRPDFPGADVLFYGTMPPNAGLSSSASLELATAVAVKALWDLDFSLEQLALLCQRAENQFVGVQCGIMDQFTVALGKADHALSLNCSTLEYRLIPANLEGFSWVITHTGKPRGLADSPYNQRRNECEEALSRLRAIRPDLAHLAGVRPEDWPDLAPLLLDGEHQPRDLLLRRARHVVFENDRAQWGARLLAEGNAAGFGRLMVASHESLREDYEVTGPELDALVEAAWQAPGCIGSRMTGAGFGGCTISLVRSDRVNDFIRYVGPRYKRQTGLEPRFYPSGIGAGARERTTELAGPWPGA